MTNEHKRAFYLALGNLLEEYSVEISVDDIAQGQWDTRGALNLEFNYPHTDDDDVGYLDAEMAGKLADKYA